jgi:hypothetical protein
VTVDFEGKFSAQVGGGAFLDAYLQDLYFDVDAADAARLGLATALMLTPGLQGGSLLALQGMSLEGRAMFNARARAEVNASADAALGLAANPKLWPLKWYLEGGLGVHGRLGGSVAFTDDVMVELTWIGVTPKIKVLGMSKRLGIELTAGFGLHGFVATGIDAGYSVLSKREELARWNLQLGKDLTVATAFTGGDQLEVATTSEGVVDVNLKELALSLKRIASVLMEAAPKDLKMKPEDPKGGGGPLPLGTSESPVLMYWVKRPSRYPPQIYADDEQGFERQRFNRTGSKGIHGSPPRKIGVAFWPSTGWRFEKRRGSKRSAQAEFYKRLEDAGYTWQEQGTEADHVVDIALAGDAQDRFDNLWPLDAGLNGLAGMWHGQQTVWYQPPGAPEPQPWALSSIPDGVWIEIRDVVDPPPPMPPRPTGQAGAGGGPGSGGGTAGGGGAHGPPAP